MAHILVVDDERQIREILQDALESEGYKVHIAPDGKRGLKCCRENEYDLIITDIIMPEKEGLELIIEVRRNDPHIKIIAMSGGGYIEPGPYLSMADRLGADKVLSKPFKIYHMLEVIRELLKNTD